MKITQFKRKSNFLTVFISAGLLSLIIFFPFIRNVLIRFGELLVGRALNAPYWHRLLIKYELGFIFFLSTSIFSIYLAKLCLQTCDVNSKNKKLQKLNAFKIFFITTGLLSLIILVPSVRNSLISFCSHCLGKTLNVYDWSRRLYYAELVYLLFLIVQSAVIFFTKLWKTSQKANMSICSFSYYCIDNKIHTLSTDEYFHYIPMFIYILILCIIHFCIVKSGDDYFFSTINNLPGFLKFRYNNWTSRLLIESILIKVYGLNFGIWRFFDVVASVVIAECMIYIALPQKKYAPIVYLVLLIFTHYNDLHTAGYGATTVNYLWTLAAFMPSFVITKKIFEQKKLHKTEIIFSLLLLLFAINLEQIAALALGLYFSFFIYKLIQNHKIQKVDLYFIIVLIFCIVSIIFILTCPGNKVRFEYEVRTTFPDYPSLNLFDKLQLGIITVLTYYFSFRGMNFVIVPLCLILSLIFYKQNNTKQFVLQIILNCIIFICFMFGRRLKDSFLFSNSQLSYFSDYFSYKQVLFECVVLVSMGIAFIYQIYKAQDKFQGLFNAFLLCAGFCSALILAFSPSIYETGTRCNFFMNNIIFLISFRLYYSYKTSPVLSIK